MILFHARTLYVRCFPVARLDDWWPLRCVHATLQLIEEIRRLEAGSSRLFQHADMSILRSRWTRRNLSQTNRASACAVDFDVKFIRYTKTTQLQYFQIKFQLHNFARAHIL